jgi:hypothetical protein
MQESGAQVEVMQVRAQQERRKTVDQQARSGERHHEKPFHGRRIHYAAHGLDDQVDRDGHQHRRVEKGHEDLGSFVGEGAGGSGGPPAQADRPETQTQGHDVAEVVRGIGKQPQAVGDEPADHLHDGNEQVQH